MRDHFQNAKPKTGMCFSKLLALKAQIAEKMHCFEKVQL